MRLAYLDSSCLVAIAFGEAGATKVAGLFLAPEPKGLAFLTLDRRQEEVARRLGFL